MASSTAGGPATRAAFVQVITADATADLRAVPGGKRQARHEVRPSDAPDLFARPSDGMSYSGSRVWRRIPRTRARLPYRRGRCESRSAGPEVLGLLPFGARD